MAPWCSIDLSSGNLTVVLEPFNCFDAEVYADELEMEEHIDFREDQRSMVTIRCPGNEKMRLTALYSQPRKVDSSVLVCQLDR